MTYNETIRVLLVDDHPFVLEGIRSCLKAREGIEVVGVAANGREALEKGAALSPNVIVMDLSMPVMNGLEATRHLRKAVPDAKVLILTLHDKKEFATQVMEAGARGYVCKNSSPAELVSAIQSIYRGNTFFTPASVAILPDQPLGSSDQVKAPKEPLSLREREVLTLIADGFSNKQTAGLLGVSVRTIEKHRERIMSKLQLHSVVELTKYAIAKQIVQVN